MVNLLQYKRDNQNNDYFRAVRNDNSTAKRVATYAMSTALIGGVAGAIFLLPAIAPLVASPSLLTALAYSGNLVFAGGIGALTYLGHRSLLRKDNRLSHAEKSIEKATKLKMEMNKYSGENRKNISDAKFARMANAYDRNIMYFDAVHDMYHRKVNKLTKKMGLKMNEDYYKDRKANPFVLDKDEAAFNAMNKNEWLYNRRAKKLIKNFNKLDDLHEDYLDYLGITNGDLSAVEEYSEKLDERRIINRTKRGFSALKNKVYNVISQKEKIKWRQEDPTYYSTQNSKATTRGKKTTQTTLDSFMDKPVKNRKQVSKTVQTRLEHFMDLQNGTALPEGMYNNKNVPLFDQIVMNAQLYVSKRDRLNLVKVQGNKIYSLQPRNAFCTTENKNGYFDALQNESVDSAPFPVEKEATIDKACEYYNKNNKNSTINNVKGAIDDLQKKFKHIETYLDGQGINTEMSEGSEILVQIDFDNPNYALREKFTDVQKAIAFTQLAESIAREQFLSKNCGAYRITSWSRQDKQPYVASTAMSAVVVDKASMEEAKTKLYNAYLLEIKNLHRSEFLKNDQKTKDSTVDIIKKINTATGMTRSEKEILAQYTALPTLAINTAIGDEISSEGESFSKRDKQFMKEQFCRNAELVKA